MVRVSVVIPIYNVEKYIEQCLVSVLKQSLKEIEIICVDDGCMDGSMQIVEHYAAVDERIIIIHKENGGLSSARNAGMEVAQGEYIFFLDSDDWIREDTLKCLVNEMLEHKLDLIFFDADTFYDKEELAERHGNYRYHRPDIYTEVISGRELLKKMAENDDFKTSACLQMNKLSVLKKFGIQFCEGIIHEDNVYTIQTTLHAQRAKHIAEAFYQRRIREDSIMTARTAERSSYSYLVCIRKIIETLIPYMNEDGVLEAYMPQLRRMRDTAVKMLKKLTKEECLHLQTEALGEQEIWYDLLIRDYAEAIRTRDSKIKTLRKKKKALEELEVEKEELMKRVDKLERDAYKAKSELEKIKSSKTYKVGKIITKIPSMIMQLFRRK